VIFAAAGLEARRGGETIATTERTCSFLFTPQPGDGCRTVSTTSFPHYSTSYAPNHALIQTVVWETEYVDCPPAP